MKKNISINLYGTLYAIDEDAYILLEKYIDSMKRYFSTQEGGEEIADDIEHRIAELLWQKKEEGEEAVNIETVRTIIKTIGNPTEIDQDVASDGNHSESANGADSKSSGSSSFCSETSSYEKEDKRDSSSAGNPRRLYRDVNDKILGGVCSGFCKYVGISDPLWFRLGIVALTLLFPNIFAFHDGAGALIRMFTFSVSISFVIPLAYIVLWIIVPAACTPEDKLRMEGKEVNPDNLREEVLKSTDTSDSSNYSSTYSGKGKNNNGCAKGCLGGCLFIILAPFILLFLFVIITILLSVIGVAVGAASIPFIPINNNSELEVISNSYFDNAWLVWAGIACGLYVAITPIVLFIRRLGSKKTPLSGSTKASIIVLWILALIGAVSSLVICSIRLSHNISKYDDDKFWSTVHVIDGISYNETDYEYFVNQGWKMKEAKHCARGRRGVSRFTYYGNYMTGDRSVRYLDSDRDYNESKPMRYTAETSQKVEPGIYRLSAAVRASEPGAYIYTYNRLVNNSKRIYAGIPAYGGDYGGNIWEAATDSLYNKDMVVKQLVDRLKARPFPKEIDSDPDNMYDAVRRANFEKGFGWSYVYIDNIVVSDTCTINYGVTTIDGEGRCNYMGWFSATDFELEKTGEVTKRK